jgi:hypothetical protein
VVGFEEPILRYVAHRVTLPTLIAPKGGHGAGFLTLKPMAVLFRVVR